MFVMIHRSLNYLYAGFCENLTSRNVIKICISFALSLSASYANANKIIIPYAETVATSTVVANWNAKRALKSADTVGMPALTAATSSIQPPLSALGEQGVAWVTDILVDRFKQEARLYLQDLMSDDLCPESITDNSLTGNRKYFPHTCNVFDEIKSANFSMNGASTLLRTAIREDIRNYPDLFYENRYISSTKDAEKKKLIEARVAITILREIRGSRDVIEIIGGLSAASFCNATDNLCTKLLNEIASNSKIIWTLSENLRFLRENLGDDYSKFQKKAIETAVESTITDLNLASAYQSTLINLAYKLWTIQDYRKKIEQLQTQGDPSQSDQTNLNYRLHAALAGISVLYQLSKDVCATSPCDGLKDLQDATVLAQAIIEENYSSIILQTVAFVDSEVDNKSDFKYLPLLVELASAQSAADMQKIFEAAAAPVGSYREKFNSSHLMSITAFAGIARTKERYGISNAGTDFGYQPFLPVGLQSTWNSPRCGTYNGSYFNCGVWGAYFSIVDLGTLAMSRQGNGSVSNNSNTGWGQVFSPGLYVTWNPTWGTSKPQPFVWGLGMARTPKLVTAANGEQTSSIRTQLFFAFDLTLFTFH